MSWFIVDYKQKRHSFSIYTPNQWKGIGLTHFSGQVIHQAPGIQNSKIQYPVFSRTKVPTKAFKYMAEGQIAQKSPTKILLLFLGKFVNTILDNIQTGTKSTVIKKRSVMQLYITVKTFLLTLKIE